MSRTIKQYGTWLSPLSAQALAGRLRLNDVQWDSDGQHLVWLEGRGGQGVLVVQVGTDAPRDLTGDLSVRAQVGYGGGDFTVGAGQVYFVGPEGRIYVQALAGGQARPITPAFGGAASPSVSADGQWLAYVHTYENQDGIALVDTAGERWPVRLAFGHDFVMQPAWHPQGNHLAYVAWDHPNMPWDGTELHLVELATDASGLLYATSDTVLAGDNDTVIFQPVFSPDGRSLAYVSDATGWGQLYVYDLGTGTHHQLTQTVAEHGTPAWIQGMRTYGWSGDGQRLYFLRNENGFFSLWYYDIAQGTEHHIMVLAEYTCLEQIAVAPGAVDQVAVVASSATIAPRIITYRADGGVQVRRRSGAENLLSGQVAEVEAITWPGHDGDPVHGLYYPPTNTQYEGTGAPPLIVMIHGGPTSQAWAKYDGSAQFFATRGFAVLDVNYRGSTGYGREYMLRLRGNWGIYDVQDAATGAQYLVDQGLADVERLVIMGGSAGGFTVYQSLIEKPGFYKAGVCLFGVANQFDLALDTHKFEERYLDSLLGPLPEAAAIYRERSPLFHASGIVDPMIIFQGDQDQVVPKNQSEDIVASLRSRGVPHEYHVYEGEGHGWRKPETIAHFHTSVLKFLQQHVLFA